MNKKQTKMETTIEPKFLSKEALTQLYKGDFPTGRPLNFSTQSSPGGFSLVAAFSNFFEKLGLFEKTPHWVRPLCEKLRKEKIADGSLKGTVKTFFIGHHPLESKNVGDLIRAKERNGNRRLALLLDPVGRCAWIIAAWDTKTGEAVPFPDETNQRAVGGECNTCTAPNPAFVTVIVISLLWFVFGTPNEKHEPIIERGPESDPNLSMIEIELVDPNTGTQHTWEQVQFDGCVINIHREQGLVQFTLVPVSQEWQDTIHVMYHSKYPVNIGDTLKLLAERPVRGEYRHWRYQIDSP